MTTPARLNIAYPPTFASSFWSHPEYRPGAISLYSRLQEGLDEDESLVHFFQQRVLQERSYANSLSTALDSVPLSAPLFEGAGELTHAAHQPRGFRGGSTPTARACRVLASECATAHADAHLLAAHAIDSEVLQPFRRWSGAHAARIRESWHRVDAALLALEQQQAEVRRLRTGYESKSQQADEAEEEARFAPAPASDTLQRSVSMMGITSEALRRASWIPDTKPKEEARASEAKPKEARAPDAIREQRREQLRQQFGFKSKPTDEVHIDAADISGDTSEDTSFQAQENASLRRQPSRISTYFSRAVDAVSGLADPRHVRLRRDAEGAEVAYQEAVRALDELRCTAEDVLFTQYAAVQHWEADRVAAVRRIIARYNAAVSTLAPALQTSFERLGVIPEQIRSTAQLQQLVHESATGPFRPVSTVFRPYYHDDINAVAGIATAGFGMDLVATAQCEALVAQENTRGQGSNALPTLPPVLHALLSALQRSYADKTRWNKGSPEATVADMNAEKRRVWLYDVPITMTHGLRRRLIEHVAAETDRTNTSSLNFAVPDKLLDAVDAPVLAATVKLWALELESPLIPYSMWDEIAEIYNAASLIESAPRSDTPEAPDNASDASASIVRGLRTVLSRLHKMHLTCIDALVCHLYKLVQATPTEEDNDRYTSRLGLSLGRVLLRPAAERPSVINSRYPALLVKDLVTYYAELFPELMSTKVKEKDADVLSLKGTIRRRSRPVDQRISRTSLRNSSSTGIQRRAAQYGSVASPRLGTTTDAAGKAAQEPYSRELESSREAEIKKAEIQLAGDQGRQAPAPAPGMTPPVQHMPQQPEPKQTAPVQPVPEQPRAEEQADGADTSHATVNDAQVSASENTSRDSASISADAPDAAPLVSRQASLDRSRPVSGRTSSGKVRGPRARK